MGWQALKPSSWRLAIQTLGVGLLLTFGCAAVPPELARDFDRIDPNAPPPRLFVLGLMGGAVVGAAERNCELIAYLAAKRARLHESQVMCV